MRIQNENRSINRVYHLHFRSFFIISFIIRNMCIITQNKINYIIYTKYFYNKFFNHLHIYNFQRFITHIHMHIYMNVYRT